MDSRLITEIRGVGLFLAGLVVALLFGFAGSASAAGCKNADLEPQNADQAKQAQAATRCLVNRERRKRGLRSLKLNKSLQKSSDWMAKDMLENEYFAHDRNGGPSFTARITRFGYGEKSNGYSLGENIAWATCNIATPREIVRMWMNSPGHRANILQRRFKEQAVSAVWSDAGVGGDYESDAPFVVFVNQFGARY